jgi:hypothetical protein
MRMSAADFKQACQDLAVREMARHHARWDAVETQRALNRLAPQARPDERLKQVDAKIAGLKQEPQTPDVARKLAALDAIRKDIAQ